MPTAILELENQAVQHAACRKNATLQLSTKEFYLTISTHKLEGW